MSDDLMFSFDPSRPLRTFCNILPGYRFIAGRALTASMTASLTSLAYPLTDDLTASVTVALTTSLMASLTVTLTAVRQRSRGESAVTGTVNRHLTCATVGIALIFPEEL